MVLHDGTAGPGSSFYFFDIDDNLMFLPTRIYVTNVVSGEEKALSTGELAQVEGELGKPGKWQEWRAGPDAYRDFEDPPGTAPDASPFLRDIGLALDGDGWKGPSWPFFAHACENRRPTAYVTARGHRPETIRAGLALLATRGLVPQMPEILGVFPVGNPDVRKDLGGADLTTPVLKYRAIRAAVEQALGAHGDDQPHRFGMSDDDPRNVSLLIAAMRDCKARYPDQRFFVINTHRDEHTKLEVFPIDRPAG